MNPTRRRRWTGGLALGGAVLLLVLGETALRGAFSTAGWMAYYLFCFLLTGLAMLMALADARSSARRCLDEQRQLFDSTLRRIETEASERRKGDSI